MLANVNYYDFVENPPKISRLRPLGKKLTIIPIH